MLVQGQQLLDGRFTLVSQLPSIEGADIWEGENRYSAPHLIKAWEFRRGRPTDIERALWDVEIRHLFRLASLPGIERELVTLRAAGIDQPAQRFVMALAVEGVTPLHDLLKQRGRTDWLRGLHDASARVGVWQGVRNLSRGLGRLHEQQMIHRALTARSVFLNAADGPLSMRLGGFEWTVRLGAARGANQARRDTPASFAQDWLDFGSLIAWIFVGGTEGSLDDFRDTLKGKPKLIPHEIELISDLIARDESTRLSRADEIDQRIGQILSHLQRTTIAPKDAQLALAVNLGPGSDLTAAIIDEEPNIPANDIERQREFIAQDLLDARVLGRLEPARMSVGLVGRRLMYHLTEYRDRPNDPAGDWAIAYCGRPAQNAYNPVGVSPVVLSNTKISVHLLSSVKRDADAIRRKSLPWKPLLPVLDPGAVDRDRFERLHEFFRLTNQIEVMFRASEIFDYETVSHRVDRGVEYRSIREIPPSASVFDFVRPKDGMTGHLRQLAADSVNGDLVFLGEDRALSVQGRINEYEYWTVDGIDGDIVHLRRQQQPQAAPNKGCLRAKDYFLQYSLLHRRKDAIERLRHHGYLMRSLLSPDFFRMDSAETDLPLQREAAKLDKAKQQALRRIWRTRPVFALQGPPGTGKTTLVANLLAQIFDDDPVAQVLVSAQAHAAVDVLRDRVREMLSTIPEDRRPYLIRLDRPDGDGGDPDTPKRVTERELRRVLSIVEQRGDQSALERAWLKVLEDGIAGISTSDDASGARDMIELFRHAASVTFGTTTARDLADFVTKRHQTFDWSIIEEAGKAHGFDLVLPLQAGHRWLLVGDQNQLPPYRFDHFVKALDRIDDAMDELDRLAPGAGGLLDRDLVRTWRDLDDESARDDRRSLWREWLPTFAELFKRCRNSSGEHEAGSDEARDDAMAMMLWQQHRMHPTIAGLIASAYYREPIESMTVQDGVPLARVVHPFSTPPGVSGCPIVWLDVPAARSRAEETEHESEPEANLLSDFVFALTPTAPPPKPLRLVVLSPYRRQVHLLTKKFASLGNLPAWFVPIEDRGAQHGNHKERANQLVRTVDSFQGDQADVVVVSLVRNRHGSDVGRSLGFLRDSTRMNVLFSRAERMLVLVGSWDFFSGVVKSIPPDPDNPLGHWRIAIDYLAEKMKSGEVLKLQASDVRRSR